LKKEVARQPQETGFHLDARTSTGSKPSISTQSMTDFEGNFQHAGSFWITILARYAGDEFVAITLKPARRHPRIKPEN